MRSIDRGRAAFAVAVSIAGVSWALGSVIVRSSWLIPKVRRHRPRAPGRDFTLASLDGIDLAATFWPGALPNSPAVLIVHGLSATRRVIQPNAEWFAARGYAVLTIDLRGHGGSSLAPHGFGWSEALDTHAAFGWLKRRQAGAPVAVIGISMGGAATLIGPLGPLSADALVLQGVYATFRQTVRGRIALLAGTGVAWLVEPLLSFQTRPRLGVWPSRLEPVAVMSRMNCPVFVIGGEKDRFTPPHETRTVYDAASGRKRLWIVPGLGHGGVSNTLTEDYRERVLAFLHAAIGDPQSALDEGPAVSRRHDAKRRRG